MIENINKKLKILESMDEIFLPHKDDYVSKLSVDDFIRSIKQKRVWKKYRDKIMKGIDRNAINNYMQGLYTSSKENRKANPYKNVSIFSDETDY